MFLPVADAPNPRGFTPWVTWTLIAVNVLVHLALWPLSWQPADPGDPATAAYVQTILEERPELRGRELELAERLPEEEEESRAHLRPAGELVAQAGRRLSRDLGDGDLLGVRVALFEDVLEEAEDFARRLRLEPPLRRTGTAHPPGRYGIDDAFEVARPQIIISKGAADQAVRAGTDDDLIWSGQSLQSRRQIRRLADRCSQLARTLTDKITDHHQACRDAYTSGNTLVAGSRYSNLGDRFDRGQSGAHSLRCLVLQGSRPAEISEHGVTNKAKDFASVREYCARSGFKVAVQRLQEFHGGHAVGHGR